MFAQNLVRIGRSRMVTANPCRAFSVSARAMGAGDTGSGFSRAGGQAAGDTWTKREKSNEELYIRNEEKMKLLALREKLASQRKHLDELDKTIQELTKDHGGEHN